MEIPTLICSTVIVLIILSLMLGHDDLSRYNYHSDDKSGIFNRETFDIQYGLPPSTSDDDHEHIKNLITLGSQSHANKKYDVVSTEQLGDISEPAPPPPPPPPPDPVCFSN